MVKGSNFYGTTAKKIVALSDSRCQL